MSPAAAHARLKVGRLDVGLAPDNWFIAVGWGNGSNARNTVSPKGDQDGGPAAEPPGPDNNQANTAIRASNKARPSVPPWSGSTTRSGWGINPNTVRPGLKTPAMSWADPLGFSR